MSNTASSDKGQLARSAANKARRIAKHAAEQIRQANRKTKPRGSTRFTRRHHELSAAEEALTRSGGTNV